MSASALASAVRRCGLAVRSERMRSRWSSRACRFRLRSASRAWAIALSCRGAAVCCLLLFYGFAFQSL